MKRRYPCEGGGRRTTPTGSSAFPEVKCPCCYFEASPVKKYGEHFIRSHRPVKNDPWKEDESEE